MATNNNFVITGFVAVDAKVVNHDNGSAWALFSLSIGETHKDKDGNEEKDYALQNIVVNTKVNSPKLDLLKKGTLIKVEGFFGTHKYTDKDGDMHKVVVWKATAIEKIEKNSTKEG